MIEDHLEAVGGGQATLISPPGRIVHALADMERSATSWVMVTSGRIHPWALANMTRDQVVQMAAGVGVLTSVDMAGDNMTLGISGLAHHLNDSSGATTGHPVEYLGTGRSLNAALDLIFPSGNRTACRRGYGVGGPLAPATIDHDNDIHSALDTVKWLAAAFDASWRVIPDGSPVGTTTDMRPRVDIAPLNYLYGDDADPVIVVSPDLADTPPMPGTWVRTSANPAVRVVKGDSKRTMDGSKLAGFVTVHNPQSTRVPEVVGTANDPLKIATTAAARNSDDLWRYKVYETDVDAASPPAFNGIASSMIKTDSLPIRTWDVTVRDPLGILSLPIGAPVGLMDVRANVMDAAKAAMAGPHGVAPIVGTRVVGRKLPFVPRVMGCYVALAEIGKGWELLDLSEWVQSEEGSVEVAETLGRTNLTDITGAAPSI
ncbi:MAG: hypothetical protein R2754_00080 [Microthrixaceae bacterium]